MDLDGNPKIGVRANGQIDDQTGDGNSASPFPTRRPAAESHTVRICRCLDEITWLMSLGWATWVPPKLELGRVQFIRSDLIPDIEVPRGRMGLERVES